MSNRFYDYFEAELAHLRTSAVEFAREHPAVAGRLDLSAGKIPCEDPYVERLLEGFAFLSARVQLKLESEFPRFTQTLLEVACPHLLGPTPSMAIVKFSPLLSNPDLVPGFTIPRGTALHSRPVRDDHSTCEFRTAHDVVLWPVELVEARYVTREIGELRLPEAPVRQRPRGALYLRFSVHANLLASKLECLDSLPIFLTGVAGGRLFEQLHAQASCMAVRPVRRDLAQPQDPVWVTNGAVAPLGYDPAEALLPNDARAFQGYRLLQEYFALPQRFHFAKLQGLRAALSACDTREFEVVLLFNKEDVQLDGRVDVNSLSLFTTPAINLFSRPADRIFVTNRVHEHHVIVDRTRPLDFEVYSVGEVSGFSEDGGYWKTFQPFFASAAMDASDAKIPAYFATHRSPRHLTEAERRAGRSRRSYTGSEVYISLVDSTCRPADVPIAQLGVDVWATNRDLPIDLGGGQANKTVSDFDLDVSAPITGISCLVGPTVPRPSRAEGQTAWSLISHLSLNYLSLCDSSPSSEGKIFASGAAVGPVAFRELLRLYGDPQSDEHHKQIRGVRGITSRPLVQPISGGGVITFVRGLQIDVTLDDEGFSGLGVYTLGSVLDQFFARYVTINSFTKTVLHTSERGEIARWNTQLGQRPTI